jgi:hypothetical protein
MSPLPGALAALSETPADNIREETPNTGTEPVEEQPAPAASSGDAIGDTAGTGTIIALGCISGTIFIIVLGVIYLLVTQLLG